MAVSRSPFSRNPKGGDQTPPNRFRKDINTDVFAAVDAMAAPRSSTDTSANKDDYTDIGTKTTLGEEKNKLDAAYNTALARIATSPTMDNKQKARATKMFEDLYKKGKSSGDEDFNPLNPLDMVRMQLNAVKKAGSAILDGAATVSRAGQVAYSRNPTNPLGAARFIEDLREGKSSKQRLKETVSDVRNKNFRLAPQTGIKAVDSVIDFGADVVFDPLTYTGVGPLKYVGKLGRTELAVKLGTTEMLAKHPSLIGKMDDIIRYGVAAVPKDVRVAEGIEYGIRFGGKIMPKSDSIASLITGRQGITTVVRTRTGDLLAKAGQAAEKTGRYTRGTFTPSSRAGMVVAGLGRGLGVDDRTVIQQVANYTAAKAAKGFKSTTYNKNLNGVRELLREIKKTGSEVRVAQLADDAEMLLREPDPVLRDLATRYKAWQDSILQEVNAVRMQFNADFGADMKMINQLDDYGIHHKMTDRAFRFAYGDKGRATGFFRDADLTATELGQNTGAAMHRRYVKGEEFMGETLQKGTIQEVNEIFRRKTGENFDFFETDIFSIADSYAYSMAAARGREAYVRRLLDFGGDVAQVINKKVVPDDELVKSLRASHKGLVSVRNDLKRKVNRGRLLAQDTADNVVKFAKKAIDEKDIELAEVNKDIGKVVAALYKIENDLGAAFVRAMEKNAESRGAFLQIHASLMEDVRVMRTAIEQGRMSEVAAYEALRTVYVKMYPDAQRIPKSASVLLDRITRNMGIKDPTEVRVLQKQLTALQKQLADTPNIRPEDLNDLLDIEQDLIQKIEGFSVLSDVKMDADYAEEGFLFGTMNDIVPKPFDPNAEPTFKVLTTRPVAGPTTGMSVDELAAARNAMLQDPNTVAVHALRPDEMMDMRTPEAFYDFWDLENGVGEAVGYALRASGSDPEDVFMKVWNDAMEGNPIHPMFEQVYPEMSALLEFVGFVHANDFPLAIVEDAFNVQVFDTLKDLFRNQAGSLGLENSDQVGDQMFTDFMRAMIEEGTQGRPILLPSRFIDEADEAAEGAYSVLLPDNFNYAERFGKKNITDDMMTGNGAPVQTVTDNDFLRSVIEGDYHTASLEASEMLEAITETGRILQAEVAARQSIVGDIRSTAGKIGGAKAAGSRRVKAAEKAYEEYAESGMVNVTIGGRDIRVTREKALEILAKKEANLNRKVELLEQKIATETGRQTANIAARKAKMEERLVTLFEQRKVIERWNAKTGDALREDIDLLKTAIHTDPPRGWTGTASRVWSDRVTARINAISRLDGTGPKDAWERVVLQLHADEMQLALLETDAIPRSLLDLEDAKLARVGGLIRDDILKGWQALESTGIQIPDDFYKVIRPNIDKLRKRAEQGIWMRALKRYNQIFKVYATMTPGFIVRNAMSATFMNKVAGVDNKSIFDGLQAVVAYHKHGPKKWLDELGITDLAEREMFESAMRSVQATGRGIQSDFVNPTLRGGWAEKIANNKVTQKFGSANEFTENALRFPMALDSLRKGQSYDESVMRITRFHFDYTDLSSFDEGMKNFIPFWVWTSRNLPLQMTEMLLRPSYYNAYYQMRERNPAAANIMMPQWINDIGPFGLGGNNVLTPDMPMNRLEQTAAQFVNPSKLVGQMTPAVKLPLEMLANKQLAMDIPFTDKYEEAKGVDRVIAGIGSALDIDALGRRNAEGILEINPKINYALGNALPSIATLQRLAGGEFGGKSTYQERQLSNIANFFGIPYREVGPRQQRGETINRQFKIRQALQDLARKGKIETDD
jgi:hypothetical protein